MNSINNTFQKFYNQLNPQQKEAVDTIEGPVMVVAGPGTGKTQVLTLRIANILLKKKVRPEKILALTFTESAASNMRRRLFYILGPDAYLVNISTFHGFCNEIIQQNPEEFSSMARVENIYEEGKHITEVEKTQFIEDVLNKGGFEYINPNNPYINYVSIIKKAISDLKKEGISPKELLEIIEKEEKRIASLDDLYHKKGTHRGKMKGEYKDALSRIAKNKEFCGIYKDYQKKLTETGAYDYDDMILYVLTALRNYGGGLLDKLQAQIKYILVDEHQDTNSAQNKVVELLGGQANVFIVGDEKQAIFRFQGASLANILYFKEKFPNCKIVSLQENYRSSQNIIDSAGSVIKNNAVSLANYVKGLDDSLLSRQKDAGKKVEVYEFSHPEQELYFIKGKIKELESAGVNLGEIAVLYRENWEGDAISDALSKEGIVHSIESSRNVFSDASIQNFLSLISFLSRVDLSQSALRRDEVDEGLIRLMLFDFLEIPASDIYKIADLRSCRKFCRNLFWIISDKDLMEKYGISSAQKIFEFSQNLSKWIISAKSKNAPQAFGEIARDSGFFAYIASKDSPDEVAKFNALFSELKALSGNNFTLADFATHTRLLQKYGIALNQKISRLPADAVRLMTVHKAKGLEFDYVILAGCVDNRWGGKKKRDDLKLLKVVKEAADTINDIEDSRRLFYVALTRARHGVFVSLASHNYDGREQFPSRFLKEIWPEFVEKGKVEMYEKKIDKDFGFFIKEAKPHAPSVHDKKFLQALFLKRGFAATHLNNYLTCPWRYFYRNLIRMPEAQGAHLMYGSAVHAALKKFFDSKLPDKEYLLEAFDRALKGQPLLEHEFKKLKNRGDEALSAYYDNYEGNMHTKTINEFGINNVFLDDPSTSSGQAIRLTGKIDKIEVTDALRAGVLSSRFPRSPSALAQGLGLAPPTEVGDHARFGLETREKTTPHPATVNVVDYKTGKRRTRNELEGNTKNSTGNEKRQLVFYKMLLDKCDANVSGSDPNNSRGLTPINLVMTSGEIDFVEPDKNTGKFYKERFVISGNEVAQLEDQIRRVADEILKLSFWDKRCEDKNCEYCKLREMAK